MVIVLKCIEILNHHVTHKELIQYIRYIIPQKQETNEHIKKERTDLWLPDVGVWKSET